MNIVALCTSPPSCLFPYVAPVKYGGPGDPSPRIQEAMQKTGKSYADAAYEV